MENHKKFKFYIENYEKTLNAYNSLNNRVRSKRGLICDHPQKFIFKS